MFAGRSGRPELFDPDFFVVRGRFDRDFREGSAELGLLGAPEAREPEDGEGLGEEGEETGAIKTGSSPPSPEVRDIPLPYPRTLAAHERNFARTGKSGREPHHTPQGRG